MEGCAWTEGVKITLANSLTFKGYSEMWRESDLHRLGYNYIPRNSRRHQKKRAVAGAILTAAREEVSNLEERLPVFPGPVATEAMRGLPSRPHLLPWIKGVPPFPEAPIDAIIISFSKTGEKADRPGSHRLQGSQDQVKPQAPSRLTLTPLPLPRLNPMGQQEGSNASQVLLSGHCAH